MDGWREILGESEGTEGLGEEGDGGGRERRRGRRQVGKRERRREKW